MVRNHQEYLGSNVTLHPYHPLFEEWYSQTGYISTSTTQKSHVVKVIGISPKWKDPALYLTMAFDDDNKGGGEIAQDGISIEGNTAFITFVDPEGEKGMAIGRSI